MLKFFVQSIKVKSKVEATPLRTCTSTSVDAIIAQFFLLYNFTVHRIVHYMGVSSGQLPRMNFCILDYLCTL